MPIWASIGLKLFSRYNHIEWGYHVLVCLTIICPYFCLKSHLVIKVGHLYPFPSRDKIDTPVSYLVIELRHLYPIPSCDTSRTYLYPSSQSPMASLIGSTGTKWTWRKSSTWWKCKKCKKQTKNLDLKSETKSDIDGRLSAEQMNDTRHFHFCLASQALVARLYQTIKITFQPYL